MKKKIFTLICSVLVSANLAAQIDSLNLTLQQAVVFALENNSDIRRQQIVLNAAERTANNSWSSVLPKISASATNTYNFDKSEKINEYQVIGTASIRIRSDYFSSIKKNNIDYQLEEVNFEKTVSEVKKTVSNSYFDILLSQQEIAYRKESLKNALSLYEENFSKYQKGFLSENEYLSSKITYEKQKTKLKAKEKELNNQLKSFCVILGFSSDKDISFTTDLNSAIEQLQLNFEINYKNEIENLLNNKEVPEIRALELKKESAAQNLTSKKFENWGPSFNFSYSLTPDFTANRVKNTLYAGVTIPLDNLLPVSQGAQEVAAARDSVTDLEIQIENQKKVVTGNLQNALQELNQKIEDEKSYKAFMEITEKNLQICQSAYQRGLMDFQSVKTASTELLDTQIDHTRCQVEILKAYTEIERICGLPETSETSAVTQEE